jgi:hypothetical protein
MTLRGAAEPLPGDPNNRQEDEIQVMREPDVSSVRSLFGVDEEGWMMSRFYSTVTRSSEFWAISRRLVGLDLVTYIQFT